MQQIAAWFQWLLSLGQPLMIGLPILAGSLAVLAYAALALAWRVHVQRAWRRRKQR